MAVAQDNLLGIASCLEGLAGLAAMTGEAGRSVRVFAAGSRLYQALGAMPASPEGDEHEQSLELAQKQLDQGVFETEWAQGLAMPWSR